MSPEKKLPFVRIEWVDSHSSLGWFHAEDVANSQPHRVISRGFLVHQDEAKTILSSSHSCYGTIVDPLVIPSQCILDLKLEDTHTTNDVPDEHHTDT